MPLWRGLRRRTKDAQPATPLTRPVLPVDPLSPEFIRNPYPVLAWLREHEPVHRSATGAWMISRFDDVYAAFGDPRLGNEPAPHAVVNARNSERYMCASVAQHILPYLDEPAHTEPRKAISRTFHRYLQDAPVDILALARQRLEPWLASGEFDVLEDFATPLSLDVMLALFGLPSADRDRLKEGSHWFFYLFAIMPSDAVRQQVDAGLTAFREYFLAQIERRRREPGDDLISAFLADEQCSRFSDAMLADTCMLLFADGIENVDAAIANGVVLFADNPQQWRRLRRNPSLLPGAIEECLRLEAPAQFIARVAKSDLDIAGQTIERASAVLLMLGSANRDPTRFDQPDVFDISRNREAQIGFGRGRHSCLGARLVKSKMSAAFTVLMQHCPTLTRSRAPLAWEPRLGHRWQRHLVVTFPASG